MSAFRFLLAQLLFGARRIMVMISEDEINNILDKTVLWQGLGIGRSAQQATAAGKAVSRSVAAEQSTTTLQHHSHLVILLLGKQKHPRKTERKKEGKNLAC